MIYSSTKLEPFFIEFGRIYLQGDLLPRDADKLPEVLFLHGEQKSGREDFLLLREILFEQFDISSCAFDFLGYGTTGGTLLPLALQDRVAQASDIIDACFDAQPLSIVATDINTDVALQLTKSFPIRHLVLMNPAKGFKNTTEVPCKILEIQAESTQPLTFLNKNKLLLVEIANTIKATLRSIC